MSSLGWLKSACAIAAISLVTGCSTSSDQASDGSSRSADGNARLASSRSDAASDSTTVPKGQTRSVLAFPTGDRATSAVQLEAIGPEQVRVGQPYSYSLRVSNLTDSPLHDVRIERMASGVTASGSTTRPAARASDGRFSDAAGATRAETRPTVARAGGDDDANPVTAERLPGPLEVWNIGTLAPRETKTRQLTGTADEEGTVANCLAVAYRPTLCVAVRVVKPELQLVKEGPSQVLICQDIDYTYRVTNSGTGAIDNVRLEDQLPEGLQTAQGQRVFTSDIGTLKQGETKTVQAKLRATKTGNFTSRATARAADVATQSREVATAVRQPVLAVNVEGPEAQYVGQAINYRVTVRNTSDTPAENTVVRLNAVGGNERIQNRNIGTLAAGQSQTFAVNIGQGRGAGNASLTAVAEATCATPAQDTAAVNILTIPALLLECVDSQDPVMIGQNTIYAIEVKNQGSGPDTDIVLNAVLPPELEFVKGGGASNVTASGKNLKFAPVASLGAGETAKWTVEVKALKPADSRFYIEMNSKSLTRSAAETEPTRITSGDAAKDLQQGLPGIRKDGTEQTQPNK